MDKIITDGLNLMVLGMGTVFVFLTIMVMLITLLAKVLKPYAHLLEETSSGTAKTSSSDDDKDVIAAIVAAVHKFRNKSK